MRSGVFDVLPSGALDFLTAEDLRLLLNGVGDINVSTLISYTTFNDESSESGEKLIKFKRWLWSIVEKMTNLERQDLVSETIEKSSLYCFLLTNFDFLCNVCRFISGLDHQHCQHQKKVSNQCHRLQFDRLMMLIYQLPIHVYHVFIYHCIRAKQFYATNYCWRLKIKISVLFKNRNRKNRNDDTDEIC